MDSQSSKQNNQQVRARIKQTWNSLTDNEIDCYETERSRFVDVVHRKYGLPEGQINKILENLERDSRKAA